MAQARLFVGKAYITFKNIVHDTAKLFGKEYPDDIFLNGMKPFIGVNWELSCQHM